MAATHAESMEARAEEFSSAYERVKSEIAKVIVGHDEIVHGVLTCLFIGGHALLEGVPGLGKTLLVRTLADALHLKFQRIQFTPDLMPADVIGTNVVIETPEGQYPIIAPLDHRDRRLDPGQVRRAAAGLCRDAHFHLGDAVDQV